MSPREHAAWIGAGTSQIDGNDGIDRLAFTRVILAHPNPPVPARIDLAIGKPPVAPLAGGAGVSGSGRAAPLALVGAGFKPAPTLTCR